MLNGRKVILVCGDRNWKDVEVIADTLLAEVQAHEPRPHLLNGGCRGADRLAAGVAEEFGWLVSTLNADWLRYGKSAGPRRNRAMLDENPDIVIAFHDNIEQSRGTKDCVNEARRRGIPVRIVSHP